MLRSYFIPISSIKIETEYKNTLKTYVNALIKFQYQLTCL